MRLHPSTQAGRYIGEHSEVCVEVIELSAFLFTDCVLGNKSRSSSTMEIATLFLVLLASAVQH